MNLWSNESHVSRVRRGLQPTKALVRGIVAAAALVLTAAIVPAHADTSLLNVSYDPTRELYQDFNQAFVQEWKAQTGETVTIKPVARRLGRRRRARCSTACRRTS